MANKKSKKDDLKKSIDPILLKKSNAAKPLLLIGLELDECVLMETIQKLSKKKCKVHFMPHTPEKFSQKKYGEYQGIICSREIHKSRTKQIRRFARTQTQKFNKIFKVIIWEDINFGEFLENIDF